MKLHEIKARAERFHTLAGEWRMQAEETRSHGLPWIHWVKGAEWYDAKVAELNELALIEGGW